MGVFGVMTVALAVIGDSRVEPTAEHVEVSLATRRFLEAVRTGDDQGAAAMLTAKARKKTSEMHMQVAPPGVLPVGLGDPGRTVPQRDSRERPLIGGGPYRGRTGAPTGSATGCSSCGAGSESGFISPMPMSKASSL